MSAENRPSAMRLKAGAGRPPPEIGHVTAGKALRAAVAQAAQDVAALVAIAGNVEESRITLEPFTQALPEHALLALVEGPDSRFGLFALDPQLVAALIEVQTTGRVVPRPAEPRPATRTDAIMCADFIDRVLELTEARVAEAGLEVAPALTGYRYAMPLSEPRAIAMTLDDMPYRLFRLSADLGHGAKSGSAMLLLPHEPPGQGTHGGRDAAGFSSALEALVMDTRAELGGTLLRREMRLSEVMALTPGALIPVPRGALSRVLVEDVAGRVVAHGRLGQVNGHRAVRLMFGPIGEADELEACAGVGARPAVTASPGRLPPPAAVPPPPTPAGGLADLGDLGGAGGLGDLGDLGSFDPGDLGDLGDLGNIGAEAPGAIGLDDLPDADTLAQFGQVVD